MEYEKKIVLVYGFMWGMKIWLGKDRAHLERAWEHLTKGNTKPQIWCRKMEEIPGKRYIGQDRVVWSEGPNMVNPAPGWPAEVQ